MKDLIKISARVKCGNVSLPKHHVLEAHKKKYS